MSNYEVSIAALRRLPACKSECGLVPSCKSDCSTSCRLLLHTALRMYIKVFGGGVCIRLHSSAFSLLNYHAVQQQGKNAAEEPEIRRCSSANVADDILDSARLNEGAALSETHQTKFSKPLSKFPSIFQHARSVVAHLLGLLKPNFLEKVEPQLALAALLASLNSLTCINDSPFHHFFLGFMNTVHSRVVDCTDQYHRTLDKA